MYDCKTNKFPGIRVNRVKNQNGIDHDCKTNKFPGIESQKQGKPKPNIQNIVRK